MKINVILSVDIIRPPLTGIGHYALRLARGLNHNPAIGSLRFFSIYRWLRDPEQALATGYSLHSVRRWLPFKPLIALLYGAMQSRWFRYQVENFPDHLLHVPNFILPPCTNPTIATIHDLSHLHYPQFHPPERLIYLDRYFPRSLQQATRLITVSQFVRQELINILGVAKERIITVYNGVDPVFRPYAAGEVLSVLHRHALVPDGYLLAVATFEPRKNLGRLTDAYGRLPIALRKKFPLILVGAHGWLTTDLERKLAAFERLGQLRQLGYISESELPFLYAGAHAFAYPSLYEGFGLPVLEAMASGVPVLTSNCSSLPEVAGDAALLIDPEDVEGLTAGLERLLEDQAWRRQAVEKGLRQAKCFSWKRCVEETVAVYREAIA